MYKKVIDFYKFRFQFRFLATSLLYSFLFFCCRKKDKTFTQKLVKFGKERIRVSVCVEGGWVMGKKRKGGNKNS